MPDKEKVIEGLKCLVKYYRNINDSSKCPYRDDVPKGMYCADCTEQIAQDALVLLKEQGNEAKRIMDVVWDTLHEGLSIDTVPDQDWVCELIRHRIVEGER